MAQKEKNLGKYKIKKNVPRKFGLNIDLVDGLSSNEISENDKVLIDK